MTPLAQAAKWGLRKACHYWAQRAAPATVGRAVQSALDSQWGDCCRALLAGLQQGPCGPRQPLRPVLASLPLLTPQVNPGSRHNLR